MQGPLLKGTFVCGESDLVAVTFAVGGCFPSRQMPLEKRGLKTDRYSREGDKEARVAREETAPTNNQEDFRKPGMSLVQDSGGRNGLYGSSRQL